MAEADTSHHGKKEKYTQEVLQRLQINEAEAQRRIQQAQQQTQQEAQTHFINFTGRITEFAENQYRQENQKKKNKLRKRQPRPIKKLKHQKNQNIILNIKMSEHQIIEQSQSREQELHQRKALVNYYNFSLQENQQLEVKINQNTVILNRNTSLKENQVGHQIPNHLITK